MPGARRQGRTCALQLLYQAEIGGQETTALLEGFWRENTPPKQARALAERLMRGTLADLTEVDRLVSGQLELWKLSRLSVVVRNLLRMAVCEMIVMGEVPFQVVINEAVELARGFTDEDSSKFVNSVLEKCWVNAADGPQHRPATGGNE